MMSTLISIIGISLACLTLAQAKTPSKAKKTPGKKAPIIHKEIPQHPTEEEVIPSEKKDSRGPPAIIERKDLADFDTLPEDRRRLIEIALQVARDSPWLPYKFGGSSPEDGGFDCSGAMYYVLLKYGIDPPRTSADQFMWVKNADRMHLVSPSAKDEKDESLKALKPGDLLFWSGTYTATDGRSVDITHVALYLGKEKKDGRPVMINATDGRSYRGKQANGYGVYDFRVPKAEAKSKLIGYGTPPGIRL